MNHNNDCITPVKGLQHTDKKPRSARKGAVIPRSERWPNNLTDEQFAALCSKLNWQPFVDAIRQDVARAMQGGGDYERTA